MHLPSLHNQGRLGLVRRLGMLTSLSTILFGASAEAQTLSGSDSEPWNPGIGVFVGYSFPFHRQGGSFAWGVEAFGTYRFTQNRTCFDSGVRAGMGPLAQLAFKGLSEPRITLALHGGSEFARNTGSAVGELGLSYQFGEHRGLGIHTGVTLEGLLFNVALRPQWMLDDATVSLGARYAPTFGTISTCVAGRPLRDAHGRLANVVGARRTGDPLGEAGACDEIALLAGGEWERDAHFECASVPAFLQLARRRRRRDGARRALRANGVALSGRDRASRDVARRTAPPSPRPSGPRAARDGELARRMSGRRRSGWTSGARRRTRDKPRRVRGAIAHCTGRSEPRRSRMEHRRVGGRRRRFRDERSGAPLTRRRPSRAELGRVPALAFDASPWPSLDSGACPLGASPHNGEPSTAGRHSSLDRGPAS